MPRTVSRSELQRLRLHNQRLAAADALAPAALVAALGAVQAQEKRSALLALRVRLPAATEQALLHEMEQVRSIVRTWLLRGTLHLVAAADLRWLLALVSPRQLRNSRRRWQQLELDEPTLARATKLILAALAERGPQTRPELAAYLDANAVSPAGQRLPHLLRRAALLGHICLGPARAGVETYALIEAWLGDVASAPAGDWAELAGRYLATYGPASVDDFASWSGALKREARAAFAAHKQRLVEVDADGEQMWLLAEQADSLLVSSAVPPLPPLRLAPAYDPLLLGYRTRDWLVAPAHARAIHPGGGLLRPTVVADGEAAGTWRVARRGKQVQVVAVPFGRLDRDLLAEEATAIGRFYGADVELHLDR